ncbi:MAG: hypothetical protein QM703_29705 [Gemmatales bacterium]
MQNCAIVGTGDHPVEVFAAGLEVLDGYFMHSLVIFELDFLTELGWNMRFLLLIIKDKTRLGVFDDRASGLIGLPHHHDAGLGGVLKVRFNDELELGISAVAR